MTAALLCVWWLAENSLVHYFSFALVRSVTRPEGRNRLPLWLAVSGAASLAAIFLRPPAAFWLSVLSLAGFAGIVLKIPAPELILPVTLAATLCTLKEGISALVLSWLAVGFQSPTGGLLEQLLVPLVLDAALLAVPPALERRRLPVQRPGNPAHLWVLLPPCVFAVLAVRWGLRLDGADFGPHLAALDIGVRLSALCSIGGLAVVVSAALGGFCGLARLAERERLLCVQLAEAQRRDVRRAAFQHDIDNHLLVLSGLLRERSYAQAERYTGRLRASCGGMSLERSTGNLAVDVLLREKLGAARAEQIAVTCAVRIPEGLGVEDTDLCALFSNLLDNAIAACRNMPPGERRLRLSARVKSQFLVVEAVNTAPGSGPVVFGTGLANVQRIARRCRGAVETELGGGQFRISVLLCAPGGRG